MGQIVLYLLSVTPSYCEQVQFNQLVTWPHSQTTMSEPDMHSNLS